MVSTLEHDLKINDALNYGLQEFQYDGMECKVCARFKFVRYSIDQARFQNSNENSS